MFWFVAVKNLDMIYEPLANKPCCLKFPACACLLQGLLNHGAVSGSICWAVPNFAFELLEQWCQKQFRKQHHHLGGPFFWRLPWNEPRGFSCNDRWSCSLNIRFFWHVALSEDDYSLGLKGCFYTGPMWENPPWKLGVFWTAKEWIYKSFYESVYEYLFKWNKWNTVECKLDPA